jgi:hypothetical protein
LEYESGSSTARLRSAPHREDGLPPTLTQRIYIHLYGREQAEEAFANAMAES